MTRPKETDPKAGKPFHTERRRGYYWERFRKYCRRYKDFNWPSAELILNFAFTHDLLQSYHSRIPYRQGLSNTALNILVILAVGGEEGYKQQALGHLLLVSRANMTKVIDVMEKKGLVVRKAAADDRRARYVHLTPAGWDIAHRVIPEGNKSTARLTSCLTPAEIVTFNKLLEKLSAKIIHEIE